MDHLRRSCKVGVSIYYVRMTKEEVVKLRFLYIMCGSLKKKFESCGFYISCADHLRRSCKVAVSIYHVWISKEEVVELRFLYIMCGSLKKKFESCGFYISCADQ